MPTVKEIEAFLFSAAPKDLAMSWDNVGLLVGQPDQIVRRVLVALDITGDVVQEAAAEGAIASALTMILEGMRIAFMILRQAV